MDTSWVVQNKDFNTGDSNINPSLTVDLDGNVYFCYHVSNRHQVSGGSVTGTASTNDEVIVVKLNGQDGSIIWTAQNPSFNTSGDDQYPTIAVDNQGSVYFAFTSSVQVSGGSATGGNDVIIVRLNASDGSTVWTAQNKNFNTAGSETYPQIVADASGVYFAYYQTNQIVSGGTRTGTSGNEIVVVRLATSDGSIVWVRQDPQFNTGGNDADPSLSLDGAGNLFLCYETTGQVSGGSKTQFSTADIAVAKLLCTDGSVVWVRQDRDFNTGVTDALDFTATNIAADPSGVYFCYYVSGNQVSGGSKTGSNNEIIVVKLDNATGSTVWTRQDREFNTGGIDEFPSIALDGVGGVYVAFEASAQVSGGRKTGSTDDIVTIKLDCTTGNLEWTYQNPSLNTSVADQRPSLAVDQSRNLYYCYYTGGTVIGGTATRSNDIVVVKLLAPRNLGVLPCFTSDSQLNSVRVSLLSSIATEHNGTVNVRGIQRFLANNVTVYEVNTNAADLCKVTGQTLVRTQGSGDQDQTAESLGLPTTTFSGEFIFIELEGKNTRYFAPWDSGDAYSVEVHGRLRPLNRVPRRPNFGGT